MELGFRKFAAWVALGVCIVATACEAPDGPSRPDDEVVIETALLSFFEKEDWQSPDWTHGDFVLLDPTPRPKERPDFQKLLDAAIKDLESWPEESKRKYPKEYKKSLADATKLRAVSQMAKPNGQRYTPEPKSPDFAKLKLDPRIVVKSVDFHWMEAHRKKVTNRLGTSGSLRVMIKIDPPGYTADGRFAIVVGHAPWSIHGADLAFFLQRSGRKWTIAYVATTFYV